MTTRTPRKNVQAEQLDAMRDDVNWLAEELKRLRDELSSVHKLIDELQRLFDEEKLAQRLDMRRVRDWAKGGAEI